MFTAEITHCLHGDLSRAPVRKHEHSRGYAAESYAVYIIIRCQLETRSVARGEQIFVLLCKRAAYYRSYCVEHISARQIERRSDLSLPCRLLMALCFHYIRAGIAELHSRICMNAVVDAVVTRLVAACHAAVRGVYYSVASESGDVALPKVYALTDRLQIFYIRYTSFP